MPGSLLQITQKPVYTRPAFFKVLNAPFLVIVFKARAVSFTVTKRLSSGTQIRFVLQVGSEQSGRIGSDVLTDASFFLSHSTPVDDVTFGRFGSCDPAFSRHI